MGLQPATFDSAQPPHLAAHLDLRATVHLQHRLGHITQQVVVTVSVRDAGKLAGNRRDVLPGMNAGASRRFWVTKASCLSDIHPRTGLSRRSAHCRATTINRRTSGVALESKDSANQTRFLMSSRTTDNVSWPFSGCNPSIVSTNDEISR